MAGPNNVIEFVIKLKDQASSGLAAFVPKLKGLATSFGGLALATAGIASFTAILQKTVKASEEAEDAMVKFNLAFKNLGATSGKTRDELVKFAEQAGKTTIFDDEKVLQAQAALLKFKSVTGATFDRARQDALDLASALGTDLTSAAETVGRAIERPDVAIRQLRASGVIFSKDQEKLIRSLVETGQTAKASGIILGELERRFKGAADVAAGTLSGAIARTKTAFDNLFEVDPKPITQAFDKLAATLNDPDVKNGLQEIIKGVAELVGWLVQAVAMLGRFGKAVADNLASPNAPSALSESRKELAQRKIELRESPYMVAGSKERREAEAYIKTIEQRIEILKKLDAAKSTSFSPLDAAADSLIAKITAGSDSTDQFADALDDMQEVGVNSIRSLSTGLRDLYKDWDDMTKSSVERNILEWETFRQRVEVLLNDEKISPDIFYKRIREGFDKTFGTTLSEVKKTSEEYDQFIKGLDQLLADHAITIEEYNRLLREHFEKTFAEVQVNAKQTGVVIKDAFDKLADAVSDALERMLNNGRFTWRELGQYLLREIAAGAIKRALDKLIAAFRAAWKKATTNPGTGTIGTTGPQSPGGTGTPVVVQQAGAQMQAIMDKMLSWFAKGLATLVSWFQRVIAALVRAFKSVTRDTGGGGAVNLLGSFLSGFAGGGMTPNAPFIAGEDGRELVIPNGSARVMNKRQLAALGGAGVSYKGGDVTVVVQGNADEKTAEMVALVVERRVQQSEKQMLQFMRGASPRRF